MELTIYEALKRWYYKNFMCTKNKHYRPNTNISHARCFACGKLIKKTKNGWSIDEDF